jgi:hypothetical protein
MTTRLYTDEELRGLRMLAKRVANPAARWSEKPADSPTHKQRTFKAKASHPPRYGRGHEEGAET